MTAKISGNALKHRRRTCSVLRPGQFTTAKIQGCANVSSYSNQSEGMRLGWQTPVAYAENVHRGDFIQWRMVSFIFGVRCL